MASYDHRHPHEDQGIAQLRELTPDWSETFRLLGDPTRMRLLLVMHYSGGGTLSMSELAERACVRTATASAALRLLTTARIVTATRDGQRQLYELVDERVHSLLHYVGGVHQNSPHGPESGE